MRTVAVIVRILLKYLISSDVALDLLLQMKDSLFKKFMLCCRFQSNNITDAATFYQRVIIAFYSLIIKGRVTYTISLC
jgi:hypothetical protein